MDRFESIMEVKTGVEITLTELGSIEGEQQMQQSRFAVALMPQPSQERVDHREQF